MLRIKRLGVVLLVLTLLISGCASTQSETESTTTENEQSGTTDDYVIGLFSHDFPGQFFTYAPIVQQSYAQNPSLNIQWKDIEPSRGVFQWESIDAALQCFAADQTENILFTLDKLLPDWAGPKLGPPRSLDDWRTFVRTVTERYKDRVRYWQIWNEPGWDKDSESAVKFKVVHLAGHVETDYPPLLKAAYEEIKQIDPDSVVIAGALNHDTSGIPENGVYLYEIMVDPEHHIQDYCDAFAIHPYYEPKDWGRFYRCVREALDRQGVDKELIVTEIGWLHNIPNGQEIQKNALGTTGIGGLVNEGARKFWIYEDMDDDPAKRYDFDYGLLDYTGKPQPAWYSYKAWVILFDMFNQS